MSRTKGAKDKNLRILSEKSLANMPRGTPGCLGATVWVYGDVSDIRWFTSLSARERGEVISRGRKAVPIDEPDLRE